MRRTSLDRIGARRQGFTLVELMIAVAIASVVIAGLYSIFIMQSRQFLFQDLQMEMHQNQRFATDVVTRSVRIAGYNTSGRVSGYLGSGSSVDNDLPAVMGFDGWSGGTDAISVIYGDPSVQLNTRYDSVPGCNTTQLTFDADVYGTELNEFSDGEMVMCFDFADMSGMETYLWVVNGSPTISGSTGTLPVHDATSYADYLSACPSSENLAPALKCAKAEAMTFYVDLTDDGVGPGSPDNPVLMADMDLDWPSANDVPLVEGVEDLQFEYCLNDADGDGSTDDCTDPSATWSDSITITEGDQVQMVRMHLLVRSSREDPNNVYQNTRPALANHAAASAADGYYRQVLVTEVTVRNLRMQANL